MARARRAQCHWHGAGPGLARVRGGIGRRPPSDFESRVGARAGPGPPARALTQATKAPGPGHAGGLKFPGPGPTVQCQPECQRLVAYSVTTGLSHGTGLFRVTATGRLSPTRMALTVAL